MDLKTLIDRNYKRLTDQDVGKNVRAYLETAPDLCRAPLNTVDGLTKIASILIDRHDDALLGLEARVFALCEQGLAQSSHIPRYQEYFRIRLSSIAQTLFDRTGETAWGERAYNETAALAQIKRPENKSGTHIRAACIAERVNDLAPHRIWLERAFISRKNADQWRPQIAAPDTQNLERLRNLARRLYETTLDTSWAEAVIEYGTRLASADQQNRPERAGHAYADVARFAGTVYHRLKNASWAERWYNTSIASGEAQEKTVRYRAAHAYLKAGTAASELYALTKDARWLERGIPAYEKSIALFPTEEQAYTARHGAARMSAQLFTLTGQKEHKERSETHATAMAQQDSLLESGDDLTTTHEGSELEMLLIENYQEITNPDCKERVLAYLRATDTMDCMSIGFIKRLTKVVRHIEREDPKCLDELMHKVYRFTCEGIHRGKPLIDTDPQARVLTAHLHAYAGDAAHRMFDTTRDAHWGTLWHDHYLSSAQLSEKTEPRHASHAFGFAATAARALFEATRHHTHAQQMIDAGHKELALSLMHAPHCANRAMNNLAEGALLAAKTTNDPDIARSLYATAMRYAQAHPQLPASEAFFDAAHKAANALQTVMQDAAPLVRFYEDVHAIGERLAADDPGLAAKRFAECGDAARDLFLATAERKWAERAYHDLFRGATLSSDPRVAGYNFGFAGKAAKQLSDITHDSDWTAKACEADGKSAELLKQEHPLHAALGHVHAGDSAKLMHQLTHEDRWAQIWYGHVIKAGEYFETQGEEETKRSLERKIKAAGDIMMVSHDPKWITELANQKAKYAETLPEPPARARFLAEAGHLASRAMADQKDSAMARQCYDYSTRAAGIYTEAGDTAAAAKAQVIAASAARFLYRSGDVVYRDHAIKAYQAFIDAFSAATDGPVAKAVATAKRALSTLR